MVAANGEEPSGLRRGRNPTVVEFVHSPRKVAMLDRATSQIWTVLSGTLEAITVCCGEERADPPRLTRREVAHRDSRFPGTRPTPHTAELFEQTRPCRPGGARASHVEVFQSHEFLVLGFRMLLHQSSCAEDNDFEGCHYKTSRCSERLWTLTVAENTAAN